MTTVMHNVGEMPTQMNDLMQLLQCLHEFKTNHFIPYFDQRSFNLNFLNFPSVKDIQSVHLLK